jgi:alkylation response protein AidB-like acyl-CoA dehydrogenase
LDLDWSEADERFRQDVRAFLKAELPEALADATRRMTSVYAPLAVSLTWQKILFAKGWAAPAWPAAHGGCDWSIARRYIFASELAAADAPPLSPMGLGMCGPILIAHGTEDQKARFLPPMLSGEELWCQGYSEPQAGSDLAVLNMQAVDDGDAFVCTGHKLWTTHANEADWIFCLVRTAKELRPQQGVTFLLIDVKSPGVEVTPIVSLSGEHIQNHVFFTEVRVPKANVVGRIGDGWTVAKHLMQFERAGAPTAPGLRSRLRRTLRAIAALDGEAEVVGALRREAANLDIELGALEANELRVMSGLSRGEAPGPMSSMLKTTSTELSQRMTELALNCAGAYAAVHQPHALCPGGPVPGFAPPADGQAVGPVAARPAAAKYFNDRAGSIYAGTNEIQRNIIAKAILGL